jgi:hypothetical protein
MRFTSVAVGVAVLAISASAQAANFSGTRTVLAGELTGTGGWVSSTSTAFVSYAADDTTTPGLWHYAYTIGVPAVQGGGLGSIYLEVSLARTVNDFIFTIPFEGPDEFGDEGNSAPNIPEVFYSLKIAATGQLFSFNFDSIAGPMWGDIYVKGGQTELWNTGFTTPDTDPPFTQPVALDHIVVPDTVTNGGNGNGGVIPEPLTLAALALGAAAVGRRYLKFRYYLAR